MIKNCPVQRRRAGDVYESTAQPRHFGASRRRARRFGEIASGANDSARRDARLHPDGALARHRRGSSAPAGNRSHWRIGDFDVIDAVHFTGGVSMDGIAAGVLKSVTNIK